MTAADHAPATDSGRVGRLGAEAIEDLTAMIGSEFADSIYMPMGMAVALRDAVARLDTLLAEQAATIERVRAVRDRARDGSTGGDGLHHAGYWEACDAIADALDDALETALGSQRTEGGS